MSAFRVCPAGGRAPSRWCPLRRLRSCNLPHSSADSQDGSPNGFHVLSVDGSHYTTRFVPAVGKGARQLRAVVDGPRAGTLAGGCAATFALDELGACEPVVNVFDGGPATRVTFEVAGQGSTP